MYLHGFEWGGIIFGGLMMLLFWGGLIFLFFWLVRAFASRDQTPHYPIQNSGPSAREILDRRYASGEISKADYEAMKEDLAS